MALVRCPECGTRISDKAKVCSYCGYESRDSLIPISRQDIFRPAPQIVSCGEKWEIIPISDEDNGIILNFLSKHENLKIVAPGLAETITSMATKNKILIADINSFTQSLIDKGELIFQLDKEGNILPTLKNADTKKISELIRLREVATNPALSSSINNLSNQVAMAQIMDELMFIEEKMANIQKELQEDRFAMADSAWDKMLQARCIDDCRLKAIAIQNAINSATDAKRVLMRNFTVSLEASINSKKPKDSEIKAQDAAKDLVSLTNCVHIECDGYAFLGENKASLECLKEFIDFIKTNRLDDRNTLLRLNENLPTQSKVPALSDDFRGIVKRIAALVSSNESKVLSLEG